MPRRISGWRRKLARYSFRSRPSFLFNGNYPFVYRDGTPGVPFWFIFVIYLSEPNAKDIALESYNDEGKERKENNHSTGTFLRNLNCPAELYVFCGQTRFVAHVISAINLCCWQRKNIYKFIENFNEISFNSNQYLIIIEKVIWYWKFEILIEIVFFSILLIYKSQHE